MWQQTHASLIREDGVRGHEHDPRHGMPDEDGRQREAVERPVDPPATLESAEKQEHRADADRKPEGVPAGLLRPLDDERARREQQTGDEPDSTVEERPPEAHE